jgi:putative transposase
LALSILRDRLYREEKLSLRLKKRRKRPAQVRFILPAAERVNQGWSMDFASGSICIG